MVKIYEVKIQLDNGRTLVTTISADSDFHARQLLRMQYGDELKSIHYVRPFQ